MDKQKFVMKALQFEDSTIDPKMNQVEWVKQVAKHWNPSLDKEDYNPEIVTFSSISVGSL